MKILSVLAQNVLKKDIELFSECTISSRARACHKFFVQKCIWKKFFAYNSPETPSPDNRCNTNAFAKIRVTRLQKMDKISRT